MSKILYPDSYPQQYKPVGAWAYFGLEILYAIPIIGLIAAIMIAITNDNIHMKNHAKAKIILLIIAFIIFFLMFLLLGLLIYNTASNVSGLY